MNHKSDRVTDELGHQNELLSRKLRAWNGIEPRPDFETVVWRRIATATANSAAGLEWFEALRPWFGVRPAWASVAAVLLAVTVGIGSAVVLTQPQRDLLTISAPTLNGQTLASIYLAMAAGEAR